MEKLRRQWKLPKTQHSYVGKCKDLSVMSSLWLFWISTPPFKRLSCAKYSPCKNILSKLSKVIPPRENILVKFPEYSVIVVKSWNPSRVKSLSPSKKISKTYSPLRNIQNLSSLAVGCLPTYAFSHSFFGWKWNFLN